MPNGLRRMREDARRFVVAATAVIVRYISALLVDPDREKPAALAGPGSFLIEASYRSFLLPGKFTVTCGGRPVV